MRMRTEGVEAGCHERLIQRHLSTQHGCHNRRHCRGHVRCAGRCSLSSRASLRSSWRGGGRGGKCLGCGHSVQRAAGRLPSNESGQGSRGGVVKCHSRRQLHPKAGGQLVTQLDGTCRGQQVVGGRLMATKGQCLEMMHAGPLPRHAVHICSPRESIPASMKG